MTKKLVCKAIPYIKEEPWVSLIISDFECKLIDKSTEKVVDTFDVDDVEFILEKEGDVGIHKTLLYRRASRLLHDELRTSPPGRW